MKRILAMGIDSATTLKGLIDQVGLVTVRCLLEQCIFVFSTVVLSHALSQYCILRFKYRL